MKKLNEIVLKNAQLLSDADMKSIEGGSDYAYLCVYECDCNSGSSYFFHREGSDLSACNGTPKEYSRIAPCMSNECTLVDVLPGDY